MNRDSNEEPRESGILGLKAKLSWQGEPNFTGREPRSQVGQICFLWETWWRTW